MMEEIVSLEEAIRLKEMGYPQGTSDYAYMLKNGEYELLRQPVFRDWEKIDAPVKLQAVYWEKNKKILCNFKEAVLLTERKKPQEGSYFWVVEGDKINLMNMSDTYGKNILETYAAVSYSEYLEYNKIYEICGGLTAKDKREDTNNNQLREVINLIRNEKIAYSLVFKDLNIDTVRKLEKLDYQVKEHDNGFFAVSWY